MRAVGRTVRRVTEWSPASSDGSVDLHDAPLCMMCNRRKTGHRGIAQDGQPRWKKYCSACRGKHRKGEMMSVAGMECARCRFVAIHPCQIHIDHIVPLDCGGDRVDPDNLQLLCANCHAVKSAVEDPVIRRSWTQLSLPLAAGPEQGALPW
jgi:hypothetical protein